MLGSGPQLCKGGLRGRHAGLDPTLGTAEFLVSVGVGGMWPLVFSASSGELPQGGSCGTRLCQGPEDDMTWVPPHYQSVVGSFPAAPRMG